MYFYFIESSINPEDGPELTIEELAEKNFDLTSCVVALTFGRSRQPHYLLRYREELRSIVSEVQTEVDWLIDNITREVFRLIEKHGYDDAPLHCSSMPSMISLREQLTECHTPEIESVVEWIESIIELCETTPQGLIVKSKVKGLDEIRRLFKTLPEEPRKLLRSLALNNSKETSRHQLQAIIEEIGDQAMMSENFIIIQDVSQLDEIVKRLETGC